MGCCSSKFKVEPTLSQDPPEIEQTGAGDALPGVPAIVADQAANNTDTENTQNDKKGTAANDFNGLVSKGESSASRNQNASTDQQNQTSPVVENLAINASTSSETQTSFIERVALNAEGTALLQMQQEQLRRDLEAVSNAAEKSDGKPSGKETAEDINTKASNMNALRKSTSRLSLKRSASRTSVDRYGHLMDGMTTPQKVQFIPIVKSYSHDQLAMAEAEIEKAKVAEEKEAAKKIEFERTKDFKKAVSRESLVLLKRADSKSKLGQSVMSAEPETKSATSTLTAAHLAANVPSPSVKEIVHVAQIVEITPAPEISQVGQVAEIDNNATPTSQIQSAGDSNSEELINGSPGEVISEGGMIKSPSISILRKSQILAASKESLKASHIRFSQDALSQENKKASMVALNCEEARVTAHELNLEVNSIADEAKQTSKDLTNYAFEMLKGQSMESFVIVDVAVRAIPVPVTLSMPAEHNIHSVHQEVARINQASQPSWKKASSVQSVHEMSDEHQTAAQERPEIVGIRPRKNDCNACIAKSASQTSLKQLQMVKSISQDSPKESEKPLLKSGSKASLTNMPCMPKSASRTSLKMQEVISKSTGKLDGKDTPKLAKSFSKASVNESPKLTKSASKRSIKDTTEITKSASKSSIKDTSKLVKSTSRLSVNEASKLQKSASKSSLNDTSKLAKASSKSSFNGTSKLAKSSSKASLKSSVLAKSASMAPLKTSPSTKSMHKRELSEHSRSASKTLDSESPAALTKSASRISLKDKTMTKTASRSSMHKSVAKLTPLRKKTASVMSISENDF